MSIELSIKSKGELFFPKKLREELNIHIGDVFKVTIDGERIILERKLKLTDLLDLPPLTKPLTYDEIEEGIREEKKKLQQLSEEDLE